MPLAIVQPVQLTGRFVTLEPIEERHRSELRAPASDPTIWHWMPMNGSDPVEYERMVSEAIAAKEAGTQIPFVVRLNADGTLVGSTRYLNIERLHGNLEIGWTWYARSAWGGPVNPDAKRLLLGHAFDMLGAIRVGLRCDARNERSAAAIERLGAVREGVLRKHLVVQHGFVRDTIQFSILAEEWPAVRDRLDRRLEAFQSATNR